MAFGFKAHKADSNPQALVQCVHLAGDSVPLGKGDPVKVVTGSVAIGNDKICQAVARAASGDRVFGVVDGVVAHEATGTAFSLTNTYVPASTALYVLVRRVMPGDEFEVLEDAVGGSVATTSVGNNINMIAANCDTITGMSGYLADSSTAATTNTLDLCVRGFAANVDNVPGNNAVLVVSFNKIAQVDQATGV